MTIEFDYPSPDTTIPREAKDITKGIVARYRRTIAGETRRISGTGGARRIDVVLDLINCMATSDLSFALDQRFSDLLSPSECRLAADLRDLAVRHEGLRDTSGLIASVRDFLLSVGHRRG